MGNSDIANIVYKSLQRDRERADISDIIRQLHQVVDEAIETTKDRVVEKSEPYDISRIDFDRLKQEFERSPKRRTTVQNLRQAVEQWLQRLLQQNPLRTDFQRHYEEIVAEYNHEKDQVTIEQTFEALLRLVQDLDEEDSRAVREGLDEESLAIFDLLKKDDLPAADITRSKTVAADLLVTLKAEKLRVDQWREKEATRDAVKRGLSGFPTIFRGLSGFFVGDLRKRPCGSSWKTRSVFQGAVGALCASTAPSASTGPVRVRQNGSRGGNGELDRRRPRTAVDP